MTLVRLSQVRKADIFDDTLSPAAIAGIEASATTHEDFLGGVLSQVRRILGGADWWGAVGTNSLAELAAILARPLLRWRFTPTAFTPAANVHVLSVVAGQAPAEAAAVGLGSALGAVCAALPGVAGTHSLDAVAGQQATEPKSFLQVFDAATLRPFSSGGQRVWALLQAEAGVASGDAFDDTTHQAQASFVRAVSGHGALEACPPGDIVGRAVRVAYVSRTRLSLLEEQDLLAFERGLGGSGGSLPDAFAVGQVLLSVDGLTFTPELPVTMPDDGWLVNNDGVLVVG